MPRSIKPVRDSAYYIKLLDILRYTATLLPIALIPVGLLSKYGITDSRSYAGDIAFIIITGTFIVTALAQFYLIKIKPYPSVYFSFSVLYHILGALYILFVSGMMAPVFMLWIVMTMAVDIYFGRIAYWLSMAALSVTVAINLQLHPDLMSNDKVMIVMHALFIGITAYVFSRLREVNDHERLALIKTREQENFQRERLLALVNSMGDAVVTTDEHGTIKVYNAALLGLLDTNATLTGKNIDKVLKLTDQHHRHVATINEARQRGIALTRTDLTHKFEDGETMRLYLNLSPIRPGYQAKGERGFIFIMRDITKEKTLEEERDEFISVISHELRTPVAIAEGNMANIKLLQEHGAASSVVAHAAEDAHKQILYLSKLINDLGALARAERGATEAAEAIDPAVFLTDIYHQYQPQTEEKQLRLDIDLEPQLPLIHVSKLYLEEIVQNLITNAIKYTKKGSITISARKVNGKVHIAVKDSGIGIGKSDQKHIFEKFYRSEDYRTRESSGTGLGLYVSKKLAAKMGIGLDFESRLNHGSTFILTIKPPEKDQA